MSAHDVVRDLAVEAWREGDRERALALAVVLAALEEWSLCRCAPDTGRDVADVLRGIVQEARR